MFDLLKNQSKGEAGVLLINGYSNIFYIRGSDGNLWAVRAHWNSRYDHWNVEAHSVVFPHGWLIGSQVFSRDS
jgi:hypothetical protein